MFKPLSDKKILLLFGIFAATFVVLAVIGGFKNYSPVPFYDTWSIINVYTHPDRYDWREFWAQHNEHRIVITRLLFWIDFKLFNNNGPLMIILNYLFVFMSFLILYALLKDMLPEKKDTLTRQVFGLVLLAMVFGWRQHENFIWEFQSQFFLAQSLPLLAFYFMHKAYVSSHHHSYFVFACIVGIMSVGTMANGILALPLLMLMTLILRMPWQYIIVLLLLNILTITAYFHHFAELTHHSTLQDSLLNHPVDLLKFILSYLSNPLLAIVHSFTILACTSLFLIGSSVFFAWKTLTSPRISSIHIALLTFILYIGGTALGTGGGRLIFGIGQTYAGRYATPTILAWAALFILYAPWFAHQARINKLRLLSVLLIPVLLLPYQFKALRSKADRLSDSMIAALALQMQVKDNKQISLAFPDPAYPLDVAKTASINHISIFNHPLIKDASQFIGQQEQNMSSVSCEGTLDHIETLEDDPRYVRVKGVLFNPETHTAPKIIHILDQDRTIVGYALTGFRDPHKNPIRFKGYLLSEYQHQPLILRGLQPDCEKGVQ